MLAAQCPDNVVALQMGRINGRRWWYVGKKPIHVVLAKGKCLSPIALLLVD
jgi:hypothetical protein